MIAIASEYIVSDFDNFASPIDVIGFNETGDIYFRPKMHQCTRL